MPVYVCVDVGEDDHSLKKDCTPADRHSTDAAADPLQVTSVASAIKYSCAV